MAASDKSVVVSSATDFSSDSTASDDWQELTKSDYAKVIFSDLLCNAALGTVECKFQITDNVHEDPNDYVGLFRIGYEDLSQCLVSKMLSQTKCEDDGKLQRCVFTSEELPRLTDGFYQFLYVTRDREVCGASMPFQIKMSPKESSTDSSISEAMDGGFLLVSNETERKVKEEPSKKGEALAQRNTLSEQKEEEIAAWVSQNPDYYSLIEQIREHTFTIDALQQSKDLAMKEVVQLYGVLNSQKSEVAQLKNMLDAYKEKVKMSQCVQDEKDMTIAEMKKSLAVSEEKVKSYEQLQKEKEEEINQLKRELLQQEEKLKMSYSYQNQLQIEIRTLNKENVEMKEKQAAKQCQQIAAETGRHPIDSVIQKAQDFVCLISDTIRNLDYTDEVERQKYYALKIEVLVMLKKMQNYLYWSEPDFEKMGIKGRSGSTSCAFENRAPVETAVTSALNITVPEVEKADEPTSSAQTLPAPNSSKKEPTNEDTSKEAVQRSSIDKVFESEVLEHQIIELPRLEVIDKDMAKTLQINKSLDAEDIIAVNRLTENMIKRGFNLYEAIEQVDDFASDSESDISEISECSSSIKKDMLCVFKVLEAVSSHLSDQTELYHLIVFGKEEDKNQINSNKLELLRKCALRYHVELLLEHIDKQKEGIKKVSEKICDLLTKYMLLKDEMGESKAICEKLKSELHSKDTKICSLKGELDFVKTLLGHFQEKSEKFKDKAELAEKSVEEFRARIEEASSLYKEQYIEIDKLQRRLRKYKSMKDKVKSSKGEFSLISSSDSSKTGSSFEVVKKDSNQKNQ